MIFENKRPNFRSTRRGLLHALWNFAKVRWFDSSTPYLTNVAAGTEAVRILGLGVAVAALGQTLALHAAAARRARGVSLRSLGVACQYLINMINIFAAMTWASQSQPGGKTGAQPAEVRAAGGFATQTCGNTICLFRDGKSYVSSQIRRHLYNCHDILN